MKILHLTLAGATFLLSSCAVGTSDRALYRFVSADLVPERVDGASINISETFEKRFSGERGFSEEESARLSETQIVFVPGLLSDQLRQGHGGYFDGQNDFLLRAGLASEIFSGPSSQATIEPRAQALAEHVAAFDRPVILIGHSKGGLEILELLLKHPQAAENVSAWAAIQTPFFGSPIADLFIEGPMEGISGRNALELLEGEAETLDELSSEVRTAYFRRHRSEIASLFLDRPSLLVSAWIGEALPTDPVRTFFWRARQGRVFSPSAYSIAKVSRDWMLAVDPYQFSDGIVPRSSAILPGARYVAIDGPDHRATIGDYRMSVWSREERERLIVGILSDLVGSSVAERPVIVAVGL